VAAADGVLAVSGLCFNVRCHEQPGGGFSAVIVFEPQPTQQECEQNMEWIVEQLREGLGWEVGKTQ
jgi:hypothetical protein